MRILYQLVFLFIISLLYACSEAVKHQIPEPPRFDDTYYEYILTSLDETIKEDPENAEAHYHKAEVLLQQGKANKALYSIRKAIELKGSEPAYHLISSKALLMKGQYREAFREAKKAANRGEPSVELYEVLAEASLLSNYFSDALKYSDSALYLAPKNYKNYFRKGIALAARKDTVTAEINLLKSIELGAPPTEAYSELMTLYMNSGNFQKARMYMEKSLALQSPDDKTLLLQARIYRHTGNQDSARSILYRIKDSQNLDQADVFQELTEWHSQNRMYDSAIHYANKRLAMEPGNKEPMLTLARIYDRRRSYQKAIREYEKIVNLDSMQQEEIHKIAVEELDYLKRKVAYLWKKQQEEELMRLKNGLAPLPSISPGKKEE